MRSELRLGLIGAGRWGRNYIRTIASLEGVRLARLASRNPASRDLVPPDCGIESEWRSLVDPSCVDAVIVCTPPALHAAMVEAAVERGLPVLVEKPFTIDLPQAQALREFVAARGGLARVDHTHLFNPAYRALKAALPGLGALRAIRGEAGNVGPFRADCPVLWDWGAHDIAMCLDLVGQPPERVEATLIESRPTAEGPGEFLEVGATFPGSIPAVLRFGNIVPKVRRFAVYLEGGVLVYDDVSTEKLRLHPPSDPAGDPVGAGRALPCEGPQPLACVVREFAAAVASTDRSLREVDLAVAVTRVLDECECRLARAGGGTAGR